MILIIGHGRSGKDTLAELWSKEFGLTFESSSMSAARIFIYNQLKDVYGYKSFEECYEDRHNRRAEWYDLICEYNKEDAARLAKDILEENDMYVGMRSRREVEECKKQGLFDLIIWVDAEGRVPNEAPDSMELCKEDADIIIENKTTKKNFERKAMRLGHVVIKSSQKHD